MAPEKGDTRRCQTTGRALSAKTGRSLVSPSCSDLFQPLRYSSTFLVSHMGGARGQNTGACLIRIFILMCIDAWFLSVNGEAGEKVCV